MLASYKVWPGIVDTLLRQKLIYNLVCNCPSTFNPMCRLSSIVTDCSLKAYIQKMTASHSLASYKGTTLKKRMAFVLILTTITVLFFGLSWEHASFLPGRNCGSVDGLIKIHGGLGTASGLNDLGGHPGSASCWMFKRSQPYRTIADKRPCKK